MKYDTIKIDAASKFRETDEGYIVVDAKIARVGIQQYLESQVKDGGNPEKVVNVMRFPEEVFCPESMRTMSNLTVTNDHPPEGRIDSSTWKKFASGFGGIAAQEGEHLTTTLTITDFEAINQWRSGRREISVGYRCEDYYAPGVHDGVNYEYVQRNISGNHIALVDLGRCGGSCRTIDAENKPKEVKMKIKIDGMSVEIADETAATVVQTALDKRDGVILKMTTDAGNFEKKKEEIEKEIDGLKGKIKDMEEEEKKKEDSAPDVNNLVADRLNNAEVAKRIMGDEYDWKINSCDQIKKDCVNKIHPEMKIDTESSDFIDGIFASVATNAMVKKTNAMGDLFTNDKVDKEIKTARSNYVDNLVNFGKKEAK